MSGSDSFGAAVRRTRRNVMKMGAILASVAVARVREANAAPAAVAPPKPVPPTPVPIVPPPGPRCLLQGTRIRTVDGERRIEDLRIGDLVPTACGGVRPIRWIARYPKFDSGKAGAKAARPVRIARSALGDNVPQADLYVTGGHCLFIDGLLIPAGDLVNGATITVDEALEWDALTYFNIKLDGHDVICAEDAPVETLLKVDERSVNFADYLRMYGPDPDQERCAPLARYGGGRGAFKSRLRSAFSPWVDRRQPIDVIRDRLEEAALDPALAREAA